MSVFGRPLGWRALSEAGRIAALVGSVWLISGVLADPAEARPRPDEAAVPASVPLVTLPADAQTTYRSIVAGGPFLHAKDGTVFGNRERALPRQPRGYYREYTVRTPGARDRGARRIVCGGQPPTRPEACYYTGDHYATFQFIAR